jgi:transcriptional regulator with XRE-family HTH domain
MNAKREWLINFRKIQGFTQQDVANSVGIDRSTYAMYESGRRNPHVSKAQEIAAVLEFEWTIFFANSSGNRQQKKITA